MRFWIPTLLLLPLTTFAQDHDPACTVSFDSAVLDTCSGEIKPILPQLSPLAEARSVANSRYRIVKFDGPIRSSQRKALEQIGARILGYAPHNAYLVEMSPSLDARARDIAGVSWTGPYLPVWKIDVNLARDIAGQIANGGAPSKPGGIAAEAGIDSLTVALHPGVDAVRSRDSLLSIAGLTHRFEEQGFDHTRVVLGFEHASLAEAVQTLAQLPEVATISLRWQNEMMNSQAGWLHQSGQQTPLEDSLPIFERGIFGCGQIVGVADSGLHATHCSFSDPAYPVVPNTVCATGSTCAPATPDFNHRKVGMHYKWDGSTSGNPADNATSGHGTHVSGSITGNNLANPVDCENFTTPGGLTDLDGTAPGAKLISQEMGASLQYLNTLGGTIYHAGRVAFENGARIHNNSWGSSCRNSSNVCIAGCQVEYRGTTRDADRLVWEHPELAVFVAAGNSGGLGGNTGCGPGADVGAAGNAKNVFSIGSNNRGTGGNAMSGFSSRGPTQDRRLKPDMTAQGASIISAARNSTCGTSTLSGTSMATPTAAGLATLVREYLVRGFYPTGLETAANAIQTPSAALIKAIMLSGTVSITGTGTTGGAPSQSQGWGRVHLDNSLHFDGDARNLWIHDGSEGLETDEFEDHVLNVEAGQPLTVILTWHDAPALVNANPHAVNRLRLEVETPTGEIWSQKLPATGGLTNPNPLQDTTTENYDTVNNVHRIRFEAPSAGSYRIRVRGTAVAQGPQPYALAATGQIAGLTDPDFLLQASPGTLSICAGEPAEWTVSVRSFEGFDDPVTLSASSDPAGPVGAFSVSPVVPADPPATSVFSLNNSGALEAGAYLLTLGAASNGPEFDARSKSLERQLLVETEVPSVGALLSPANQAVGQTTRPSFSWEPFAGAGSYRFELATDPAFDTVVLDTTVAGTSLTLTAPLANSSNFYWRVSASNACGNSAVSSVFSFRTAPVPGQCDAGTVASAVFSEDFSEGIGGFSTDGSTGAQTWAISTARPSPLSGGNAMRATNIATVSDQRLTSPVISLPSDAAGLTLVFQNWRNIENNSTAACYDGGILEIAVGDGAFTQLDGAALVNDPYRGPISSSFQNPLGGRNAWCEPNATPRPYGDTLVDLNAFAGQDIRLRWRLGTDNEVAREGWFVDDIRVQACLPEAPGPDVFKNGFEAK